MHPPSAVIDRWFRPWQRQPAPRVRLFCMPYAGGQASVFASWAGDLGGEVELRALALPGRGARLAEAPLENMGALLDTIEPLLLPLLDAPFALFGHSMGATIAFELTRRLRRRGAPLPLHLFVSAARTPRRLQSTDTLHPLSDADLIEQLRRLGGTPEEILSRPDLLALVLPSLRADLRLLERWVSPDEPPLPVPLTALGGRGDARVSSDELALWRAHTSGPFAVQLFRGDHFYLQGEREALLASLRRALFRGVTAVAAVP
jgi:medium-chain acyl-[acyl-carrier-protein] hydrolase